MKPGFFVRMTGLAPPAIVVFFILRVFLVVIVVVVIIVVIVVIVCVLAMIVVDPVTDPAGSFSNGFIVVVPYVHYGKLGEGFQPIFHNLYIGPYRCICTYGVTAQFDGGYLVETFLSVRFTALVGGFPDSAAFSFRVCVSANRNSSGCGPFVRA
jgi:hypothetical protein